jgi:hypothetical protein
VPSPPTLSVMDTTVPLSGPDNHRTVPGPQPPTGDCADGVRTHRSLSCPSSPGPVALPQTAMSRAIQEVGACWCSRISPLRTLLQLMTSCGQQHRSGLCRTRHNHLRHYPASSDYRNVHHEWPERRRPEPREAVDWQNGAGCTEQLRVPESRRHGNPMPGDYSAQSMLDTLLSSRRRCRMRYPPGDGDANSSP